MYYVCMSMLMEVVEIKTLRHGLWTHVARRQHAPKTVYFASDNELMLHGTVKYVLRADTGSEVEVPWAGRVVFSDGAEGVKMRFYQVYLVSSLIWVSCIAGLMGLGSFGAVGEEVDMYGL